ncbi:MAG: DUF6160 family protein [Desulfomonilia bacterium]
MKRVFTFLAIMLLPLSVMAMTPVSDQTLSDVTGQAGVNINADLRMDITIGTLAWGDADGITAAANPGWALTEAGGYVGVTGLNITDLRIKARETDNFGIGYPVILDDDDNELNPGGTYLASNYLKPITIDVATDPDMYDGATFVRFGLGSLEISMDALTLSVELGPDTGLGQQLGVVNIGPLALYINPTSFVDIYAGSTCGVNLTFNVKLDQLDLDYVSWGDTDGQDNMGIGEMYWMATGAQSAGYIGLADLSIGGPITVVGSVAIDVTTSYAGVYSHGVVGTDAGAAPVSVVHISFPDMLSVAVGPITANVKLDGTAALGGANAGTLGDIYIAGFGLDIYAGSWVDIWAH